MYISVIFHWFFDFNQVGQVFGAPLGCNYKNQLQNVGVKINMNTGWNWSKQPESNKLTWFWWILILQSVNHLFIYLFFLCCAFLLQKSLPSFGEDSLSVDLTTASHVPSPVSVLDASFYKDDLLPSPIKKMENPFPGEVSNFFNYPSKKKNC